jgi:hypothetical protein
MHLSFIIRAIILDVDESSSETQVQVIYTPWCAVVSTRRMLGSQSIADPYTSRTARTWKPAPPAMLTTLPIVSLISN